jgi:hypothetical protein
MIVYLTGNKGYILYVLYRLHVRENQRDNELWIVHRHMQYYEQDTERRPTKQKITQNGKWGARRTHHKIGGKAMCTQWARIPVSYKAHVVLII